MADITTIPFEYLVISSGYTGRLLEELETLSTFCQDFTIIPLYIRDDVHSDGQIKSFSFEDGIIEIIEPTVECEDIQTRLENNRLKPFGIIVFRIKNFDQVNWVIQSINRLEYCCMYGFPDIKVLKNSNGVTDLVWVEFDAESG